jgi:hypothetical protein
VNRRYRMTAAVAWISLAISLCALSLSILSWRDRHRHRRDEFTLALLQRWDIATLRARSRLSELKDIYAEATPTAIAPAKIEETRKSELEKKASHKLPYETPLVTDHIHALLNYMEDVAWARSMGLVNEGTIRLSLSETLHRWYCALSSYVAEFGTAYHREPWEMVTLMLRDWFPRQAIPEPERPAGTFRG